MDEVQILEHLNSFSADTLMEHLDIRFSSYKEGVLEATMEVGNHTVQPLRMLHGGALMALAESVASTLSNMHIGVKGEVAIGSEISGHHLKSTRSGTVTAKASILHKGRSSHVVDISIFNKEGQLINVSRMTNRIVPLNGMKQ